MQADGSRTSFSGRVSQSSDNESFVHANTVCVSTHTSSSLLRLFLARTAAELSASSAARAQLWTEVQWTELDYTQPPQHHNEGDENDVRQAEEGQGEYSYVCKCGSRYVVSEAQVDRLLDEEDKDVDEIRLSCDWCSLGVRITTDER